MELTISDVRSTDVHHALSLWTPENTPLAKELADLDRSMTPSWPAPVAGAATSSLGVLIGGTDATRRGPAELLQSMLSLADLTEGNASVVSAPAK